MVIWTGHGRTCGLIFPISYGVVYVLYSWIFPDRFSFSYEHEIFGYAFLLAAPFFWLIGKRLRRPKPVYDEGHLIGYEQPLHSLFWIKIHHWAPICLVVGLGIILFGGQ